MAATAIINWISSPDYAETGDVLSIRCQCQNTGDERCYFRMKLYDNDTDVLLHDYGESGKDPLAPPGSTWNPRPASIPMPDSDLTLLAKVWVDARTAPDDTLTKTTINGTPPPVITSISWLPTGSFHGIAAGASLVGRHGSLFTVFAVGPSVTHALAVEEIIAELAGGAPQVYKRNDTFMLDGEGFTILHAIDDGECSNAVIAKNISTNQHPTVGEEVQFSANINWNDDGATTTTRRMEWYYLKPPSESYTKAYADDINNWTHFATDILPAHTFTAIDDADIIYLKVIAQNKANQTAEFGFGNCSAGLFNLWGGADGFEITVVDATGTDKLTIAEAVLIPGTNAWTVLPILLPFGVGVLQWINVTERMYFGTSDSVDLCVQSDPHPDHCDLILEVGKHYAVFRSTMGISVIDGKYVHELKSGRNGLTVDRTLLSALETTVCGLLGISGTDCTSFIAEFNDVVFVGNYYSLQKDGVDMFGNVRELTWFDHMALPFALAATVIPLPFGRFVSEGLEGFWKGGKHFTTAAFDWMETVAITVPLDKIVSEGPWSFMQSIVRISGDHLDEVMELIHADDFTTAAAKLEEYLASDLGNTPYRTYTDFNDALRKYLPLDEWEALMNTIYGFAPQADSIIKTASKTSPTADDLADIAHAAGESGMMDEVGDAVYASLKTADHIVDPVAKAQKLNELENIAENFPQAFDEIAKKPIATASEAVKHSNCVTLGVKTTKANRVLITKCFKKRFDNVLPYPISSADCDGIIWMVNQDPIAAAKAFDDYTDLVDKERLLLSLGKSGVDGQLAASWLSAAKQNIDLDDVYDIYGMNVYEVMNHVSQAGNYAPGGIYDNLGVKVMGEAADGVPRFTHVKDINKFIQEVSDTVRIGTIGDEAANIAAKARAGDTRGISQIFQDAGVDVIHSDALTSEIDGVQNILDDLGDAVTSDDITRITERIVEANVVDAAKIINRNVRTILSKGAITKDEIKALSDIVNNNPLEMAVAVSKLSPVELTTFEAVLDATAEGKSLRGLIDLRGELISRYGDAATESVLNFARQASIRGSRAGGGTAGSGIVTVKTKLFEAFAKHWKLLIGIYVAKEIGEFILYYLTFEHGMIIYGSREAGAISKTHGTQWKDLAFDVDANLKALNCGFGHPESVQMREVFYDNIGMMCELIDYAVKNPISEEEVQKTKEILQSVWGITEGAVREGLHEEEISALKGALVMYNASVIDCIAGNCPKVLVNCVSGYECVTGEFIFSQRSGKSGAFSSASEYQAILDEAWTCVPGHAGFGTIRCTSNQVGFAVYLDGDYIDHSYGNTWLVIQNVPIGAHTVKIEKGTNYTPECCEDIVTVTDGGTVTYDCQMTKIGDCSLVSSVIISLTPKNPIKDEPVAFTGYATSDDPIETWEWDFGDETPKVTGQAVTHTYTKIGIFKTTLTVTNDCGNSDSADRMVTVLEEPVEESGTLLVKEPIDSVTSEKCAGSWTAEIYVDNQAIGKTTQFSIPFGTNSYVGGYGGQCGDHVIKVVLSGYDDAVKSVTINNGDSKSWQPIMALHGAAVGTVKLTSNQTGFAGYVDGKFVGNSGTNNYLNVPNVAVGSRTVKIVKGMGYTPKSCEDTVTVPDGGTVTYDCQMTAAVQHTINVEVPVGSTLWVDGNVVT